MESSEITKTIRGNDEHMRRRFRIKEGDLAKFGRSIGCPVCKAGSRGATAVGHDERPRKRIAEELAKIGVVMMEPEKERLLDCLDEQENQNIKT